MTTRIELTPAAGRPRVRTSSGLLRPQVRSVGADSAKVTLVATGATLLGGDHIDLDIVVGSGLTLDLSDVAGTVVYDGRGQTCSWHTTVAVAAGATLIWHGEPLVVSSGGELFRNTAVEVADGGRLLMRDTLALGRSGEDGGRLTCRTRMAFAGAPALAEDLPLSPERRTWPGMLGDAKVLDTVTALGWTPAHPDMSGQTAGNRGQMTEAREPAFSTSAQHPVSDRAGGASRFFDLPCPGTMARSLVPRAHLSDAPAVWTSWRRALALP